MSHGVCVAGVCLTEYRSRSMCRRSMSHGVCLAGVCVKQFTWQALLRAREFALSENVLNQTSSWSCQACMKKVNSNGSVHRCVT